MGEGGEYINLLYVPLREGEVMLLYILAPTPPHFNTCTAAAKLMYTQNTEFRIKNTEYRIQNKKIQTLMDIKLLPKGLTISPVYKLY
jgi:hypothetical protein